MNKDEVDGVGIIIADSIDPQKVTQVLLMKRGEKTRFSGQWENCGGSVEPGETSEEAIRRELKEELGVEAAEIQLLFTYQPFEGKQKSDHIFIATINQKPQIAEENVGKCAAIDFISIEDLQTLPLVEYAKADFRRLGWIS